MSDLQQNSKKAILAAVSSLSTPELDELVGQVIAIRARRFAPSLNQDEQALLTRINAALPTEDRVRMRSLIEKRDATSLPASEWEELTGLIDRLEVLQADRIAALVEWAKIHGITLDEAMIKLGIHFPNHD